MIRGGGVREEGCGGGVRTVEGGGRRWACRGMIRGGVRTEGGEALGVQGDDKGGEDVEGV